MLKVNEEKLLLDHKELIEKKEKNLAAIEVDAKAFACAHGYDEKTTVDFVAFTEKASGYGLTAEENTKLEVLASYIEESAEFETESGNKTVTTENGIIDII